MVVNVNNCIDGASPYIESQSIAQCFSGDRNACPEALNVPQRSKCFSQIRVSIISHPWHPEIFSCHTAEWPPDMSLEHFTYSQTIYRESKRRLLLIVA